MKFNTIFMYDRYTYDMCNYDRYTYDMYNYDIKYNVELFI